MNGPVALICVNYGSSHLLADNFAPLAADQAVHGVVVDNLSSAEERARAQSLAEANGWRLLTPDGNLGFGQAVNLAVAELRDDFNRFVVINPDATMSLEALARLVEAASGAEPTLAAPKIQRPDGSDWFTGSDLYLADGSIRASAKRPPGAEVRAWLTGAVLAFDLRTWDLVGGFDDDYFLYWEDVDLCWRLEDAGARLRVVGDAIAVHSEGGTQAHGGLSRSGQAKSAIYYYYNIRNRLLFGAKHLPRARWRQWLRHTPRVSWQILLQGGRRQFLSRQAPIIPLVRGMVEGVRLGRRIRRTQSASGEGSGSS